MPQIIFITSLYFIGLQFGLLFKKKINILFLCSTAFLWGSLIFSIATFLLLSTYIAYTLGTTIVVYLLILLFIILIHLRQRTWQLSRNELITCISFISFFITVLYFSYNYNISVGTTDSVHAVLLGRGLAKYGFRAPSPTHLLGLTHSGMFLSTLQSFSYFLRQDYLHVLQTAIAFSSITTFAGISYTILHSQSDSKKFSCIMTIYNLFIFLSSGMVFYHLLYLSTIPLGGMFYVASLGCFWLAYTKNQSVWVVLGFLSAFGYVTSRIEGSVIILAIIPIFFKKIQCAQKTTLYYAIISYLAIMLAWSLQMLHIEISINAPSSIGAEYFIILAAMHLVYLCILLLPGSLVQKFLWSNLYLIILLMIGAILTFLFIIDSKGLIFIFRVLFDHLFTEDGGWGITWFVILLTIIISQFSSRIAGESIFIYSIIVYILFDIILAYMNMIENGDASFFYWLHSSNRMLFIILPIILIYISLKFNALNPRHIRRDKQFLEPPML